MYNFAALNRWDRFRVWLGDGTGLFPETFLKRCGGVTGLGTHISPNHLLETDYCRNCGLVKCMYNCRVMYSANEVIPANDLSLQPAFHLPLLPPPPSFSSLPPSPHSDTEEHFAFVLTDLEGKYRFGFCRSPPKGETCMCFLRSVAAVVLIEPLCCCI